MASSFPRAFYEKHPLAEKQRDWLVTLDAKVTSPVGGLVVCPTLYERLRLPEAITKGMLPINHRAITQNEIVIECDDPDVNRNAALSTVIAAKLDENKVPYVVGYSGGKSFHFHTWINFRDVPVTHKRVIKYFEEKELNPRDFRNWLFKREFLPFFKTLEKEVGETRLDLAMLDKNHLVREFGGLHEKTGQRKTVVLTRPIQVPPPEQLTTFPDLDKIPIWKIRQDVLIRRFADFILDYEEGIYLPAGQAKLGNFKRWSK